MMFDVADDVLSDYERRKAERLEAEERHERALREYQQEPIDNALDAIQEMEGFAFRLPGVKPTQLNVGGYALLMCVTGIIPKNGNHDIHWISPMATLETMVGKNVVYDEGYLWRWDHSACLWRKVLDSDVRKMVLRLDRCFCLKADKKIYGASSKEFAESCLATVRDVVTLEGFFKGQPMTPEGPADGSVQVGSWIYLHRDKKLTKRRPVPADAQRHRLEFELPEMIIGNISANPCFWHNLVQTNEGIWQDAAPNFFSFLDSILPDKQAQELFRSLAGLSLLGLCAKRQQHLWLAGTKRGRNGKGTLCNILKLLIGEQFYCDVDEKMADHEYLRAPLMTARLGVISEAGEWGKKALLWLKRLTGGDTMLHREQGVQGSQGQSVSKALTIACSNSLPYGLSEALLRRFQIIDLNQEIPAEQDVPWVVMERRIRPELGLITAWMLQAVSGYVDQIGLPPCNESDRLKAALMTSADCLTTWLQEHVAYDPSAKVGVDVVMRAYRPFLGIHNDQLDDAKLRESMPSVVQFGRELAHHLRREAKAKGIEDSPCYRSHGTTFYRCSIISG